MSKKRKVKAASHQTMSPRVEQQHAAESLHSSTWNPIMWGIVLVAALVQWLPLLGTSRSFLNYDDTVTVELMLRNSFLEYFTRWIPEPKPYPHIFPVRDATYFLDHFFSTLLHTPTFWVTNIAILAAEGILLAAILRRCGYHLAIAAVSLALILFHPQNVEAVQWISARRNLLPVIFSLASLLLVVRQKQSNKKPGAEFWIAQGTLLAASLLSYPSAILYPLWLYWIYRKEVLLSYRSRVAASSLFVLGCALYYRMLGNAENDWTQGLVSVPEKILSMTKFGVMAFGRATYNTVFPHRLAMYYNLNSAFNLIGLAILLVTLVALAYAIWKLQPARRAFFTPESQRVFSILDILLFGLILFAPQSLVFLTFSGFVWADRYMHIVLAPIFLAFASILEGASTTRTKRALLSASCIAAAWFAVLSYQRVPIWLTDSTLAEDCANNEKSEKCIIWTVEENFANAKHAAVIQTATNARSLWKNATESEAFDFKKGLPFYETTAIVLSAPNVATAQPQLSAAESFYQDPSSTAFAKTLLSLRGKNLESAKQNAFQNYLSNTTANAKTTRTIVAFYIGHGIALCEKIATIDCTNRVRQLQNNFRHLQLDTEAQNWGYRVTKTILEKGA